MRTNNGNIPPDEQTSLLLELQNLLERQIELAEQGSIKEVEAMAGQANSLVKAITERGILEKPEFQNRRLQFQKLYKDLCLVITAHKAETGEKLSHVRKGRKMLGTYRSNFTK